ncbi:hypothetical protein [Pontibacter sp. G13]|uniref:hypothetical protein n=1 Tax=Pontibacter sp. G13 TaxID=3074898 RepID=UPI00288A8E0A|nr:hypothetical protein [Pontibacter sp. G13]WNJ16806.1 hypothetical protein RJD25_18210 [Pontibacter sp. G13]
MIYLLLFLIAIPSILIWVVIRVTSGSLDRDHINRAIQAQGGRVRLIERQSVDSGGIFGRFSRAYRVDFRDRRGRAASTKIVVGLEGTLQFASQSPIHSPENHLERDFS